MKTRISLKYFVNDCLWPPFLDSNLHQAPSDLIFWTILVTLRPFTFFQAKSRAIKLQISAKICLTT